MLVAHGTFVVESLLLEQRVFEAAEFGLHVQEIADLEGAETAEEGSFGLSGHTACNAKLVYGQLGEVVVGGERWRDIRGGSRRGGFRVGVGRHCGVKGWLGKYRSCIFCSVMSDMSSRTALDGDMCTDEQVCEIREDVGRFRASLNGKGWGV